MGLVPDVGKSPEGGHGNPLQYSCLEYSMDRGAWWVTICGIAESDMTEVTERATYINLCDSYNKTDT